MRPSCREGGFSMLAAIVALTMMIALVTVFSASTGDLIGQARLDRAGATETNLRRSAELWARMHPTEARDGRQLDVSALDLEQAELSVKQTGEALQITGGFTMGTNRVRLDTED